MAWATQSPMNRGSVSFSAADAHRAFLTSSRSMWRIFEPDLRRRLADLKDDATFTERTQAVLVEALPSGAFAMDDVARRLAVSTRTLKRRLNEEDTSFTEVVRSIRHSWPSTTWDSPRSPSRRAPFCSASRSRRRLPGLPRLDRDDPRDRAAGASGGSMGVECLRPESVEGTRNANGVTLA